MNSETFVRALASRLREKKPGLEAQLRLAPAPRPGTQAYPDVPPSSLQAGVLVLLYPGEEGLRVLLTRRTAELEHHQAQISFPGGQQEPEEDLQRTATREAQEEVGTDPQSLRILGRLTPLFIPPSNYCIHPTVAFVSKRPKFRLNEKEVAEVLEVSLDHLADPSNFSQEMWIHRGSEINVPFFTFREHKIWGATAMVLAELMAVLEELPQSGPQKVPGEGGSV